MTTTGDGATAVNRSVLRAATILGLFTVDRTELSLADMASSMNLSRATVHRYVSALRQAGLLRLTSSGYSLGPRLIELASTAVAGLRVATVAGPFMTKLVADVNQTAVLSVWDGDAPIVVRVEDGTTRQVRITVSPGTRLGSDSAQGLVFRSFHPGGNSALDGIRKSGIAFSASNHEGIAAIACPVFQADEIVATLALLGTVSTIEAALYSPVGSALRSSASALSVELGRGERADRGDLAPST